MSAERRISRNEQRFRGVHESTIRDLMRFPVPDVGSLRAKFAAGDFDGSEAYFVGTWLVHTRSEDHRRLGLAFMSQAVELNPTPRHNWALRHESKTSALAADIVPVVEPSMDFLDYVEIARIREERRRMKDKPKKIRRTHSRRRRSIWSKY